MLCEKWRCVGVRHGPNYANNPREYRLNWEKEVDGAWVPCSDQENKGYILSIYVASELIKYGEGALVGREFRANKNENGGVRIWYLPDQVPSWAVGGHPREGSRPSAFGTFL